MNEKYERDDDAEVAYILKGYPRLSETFILNEIYLLESMGIKLHIFSARERDEIKSHAIVEQIKAKVTYLPEMTSVDDGPFGPWLAANLPRFLESHLRFFLRRPKRYLQTLIYTLFGLSLQFPFGAWPIFKKGVIKDFLRAGYIALEVVKSPHIRHLHGHFSHGATTITMLTSYLTGIPFSFTAHAKDIYLPRFNPHGLLQTKLEKAAFVVTCTDANHTYLEQLCPQGTPIHTIYHGLDTNFFKPIVEERAKERAKERAGDATPTILTVGRFVKKKGFPSLIQACRKLKERAFVFQCRIIGQPDEDSQRVQELIRELGLEDIVHIDEGMTQDELRHAYAQATIFAMPCQIVNNGDRDGIPNVLAEAMAMALPVVATNVSGIPELVEDHVDGLLVPQKDVEAMADALATLLEDAVLRHRLGESARNKICRLFDSRKTTLALCELFVGSLEKHGALQGHPPAAIPQRPPVFKVPLSTDARSHSSPQS